MSFLHFYLLGGLSLVAVPILIHLVTREKPKHLRFPAFRFLLQKYHVNRRKLRLHHLLLLLLRMLLIAALCLALARPRLHTDLPEILGGSQPVVVVLAFDTSSSMDYERGGLTRLEDARRRALELLEELPDGSRVALLDSAESGGDFVDRNTARDRLKALQTRPDSDRVSKLLDRAYSLLNEEESKAESGTEPLPRYVYFFSDRTRASWDAGDVRGLKQPEGVNLVYVDVGAEKPTDLAIEKIIVDPPAVTPGNIVRIRAVVLATGERADRKITCQIDNEPRLQEKPIQIEVGEGASGRKRRGKAVCRQECIRSWSGLRGPIACRSTTSIMPPLSSGPDARCSRSWTRSTKSSPGRSPSKCSASPASFAPSAMSTR
jgi:Aerotolerance regulator N-terminal